MKAFEKFPLIFALENDILKQKAWLEDYKGNFYSIGQNGIDIIKWKEDRETKNYYYNTFNPAINKISRKKDRLVIEFDTKINGEKNQEAIAKNIQEVKEKLEKMNVGYIETTHKGASNYIWVEFNRELTSEEAKAFLKWIAPEGSEIDLNFSNDNFCFPVMFAIHWKHSNNRELPINWFQGEKIDYDSLNIKITKTKSNFHSDLGFKYETFLKPLEEPTIEKKPNPYKKLHYSTEHLPYFHEFSNLIGLNGRHYIPIIKARLYQLYGGILQSKIQLGSLITDSRVHIAYPLVTEGGKNEIIYSIKGLLARGIKKDYEKNFKLFEPISYSPESLIGKTIERDIPNPKYESGEVTKPKTIKTRIKNIGSFGNDFLEFDECNKLITGTGDIEQQAREYISKSENPIGRNIVEKRLVDDTEAEAISIIPECTNSYYFQPFGKIPESAMLQGFMRRKLIPVGNVNLFLTSATEELFNSKLSDKDFSERDYQDRIVKHLEVMRSYMQGATFIFTEEAKKLINEFAVYLNEQGNIHSEKISNYCKLTKYSCLSNLVKLSCIISASYLTKIVDTEAVSLAFMDLVELNQNTFDFVYDKVEGEFDYGGTFKTTNYKEKECLKFLFDSKALSYESSSVTIEEFVVNVLAPIFKIKERQARNRYLEMKKKGLIDSKQVGKNDSRVWLNFNPNEHKTYVEGGKDCKGYNTYNSIFLSKNSIISKFKGVHTLHSLQPLK